MSGPTRSMTTPDDAAELPSHENVGDGASPFREYFLVGVGASAGGLDAISELLKALPGKSNVALVVVQHLDPTHESLLVELLARVSPLPVQWAEHGISVEAGN